LGLSSNNLSLSLGGGSVSLTPYLDNTDAQTLNLTGNQLSISGGNTVTLPTGTTYTAGSGIDLTGNVITNTSMLPTGTTDQTLRHNGTNWVATNYLRNSGTAIGINTAPNNLYSLWVNGAVRIESLNATGNGLVLADSGNGVLSKLIFPSNTTDFLRGDGTFATPTGLLPSGTTNQTLRHDGTNWGSE
jgi:hypothetical protein